MGEETTLSVSFKEAVVRWLVAKGIDAVSVTGWDEWTNEYGGCPTCGPSSSIEVDIYYLNSEGTHKSYNHDGTFSYLLTELLNA